jgi:outer membrane protein TolC
MRSPFLALAVLLLIAGPAMAETSLGIDQAVAKAAEQNLNLQRVKTGLNAAQRAVNDSWSTFLPSATASTGLSGSQYWTDGGSWSTWLSLTLGMSLAPSFLEKARQIRLAYDSQSISYERAQRSLELSVRKAFYAILLNDEKVRLAGQKLDRAKQSLDETTKKYNAGLIPDLDVLSARVSYDGLKPALESAKTTRDNALEAFKLLLGIDLSETLALSGSLEADAQAITLDAVTARILTLSEKETLGMRSLMTSLQIARSAKAARVLESTIPSASVSLSTNPTLSLNAGSLSDMGSARLMVSFDVAGLIPGSSTQAAIASADDSIRSLESQLAEEKLTLSASVQSYVRSIRTAVSSLDAYTSNVALAQKSYDLMHDAYLKGLKTLSDVENASASLDEARVSVLGECYILLAAALDLEYTLDLDFGTIAR